MLTKLKNIGIALLVCMGAAFAVFVVLRGYSWHWGLIVGGILTALYAWRELTYKPPAQSAAQPAAPQQEGTVHDVGHGALTAVVIIDIALYLIYFICAVWIRVPAWIMMGVPFGVTALILIPWVWGWRIEPEPNTISAEFFFRYLVLGRSVREGWKIYPFRGWFYLMREATYPEAIITDVVDGADVWTAPVDPNAPLPEGASSELAKMETGQVLLDIALSLRTRIVNAAKLLRAIGPINVSQSTPDAKGEPEGSGGEGGKSSSDAFDAVLAGRIKKLTTQMAQGAMQRVIGRLTIDEALADQPQAISAMAEYINGQSVAMGLSIIIDNAKLAVGEKYRQARERAAAEKQEINAVLERRTAFVAAALKEVDQRHPGLQARDPELYERLIERLVINYVDADYKEKIYDFGMLGALAEALLKKLGGGGTKKRSGKRGGSPTEPLDDEEAGDLGGGTGSRRGGN